MRKAERNVIAVFTAKTVERIFEQGGTASWVLKPSNAQLAEYAVCCRNTKAPDEPWTGGRGAEPHGAAFLIGRIQRIEPSSETNGRWLIRFSDYATVLMPNVWRSWRNPVRYTDFDALGIDPKGLTWTPMPSRRPPVLGGAGAVSPVHGAEANASDFDLPPLTLTEAKRGLARAYGVPVQAVEITIRG